MQIEAHDIKTGLAIIVDNFRLRKTQTAAPIGSLTKAIKGFIIDINIIILKKLRKNTW